jgi:hypothetical protein
VIASTPETYVPQSESPYTYSYTLANLPVQAGTVTGTNTAYPVSTFTDDGAGNLISPLVAFNSENPYISTYVLAWNNIVPGSISGSTSYGGSLNDDTYGNLFDSYYGQIATIDYVTGQVTDITYGYVSTSSISYSYNTFQTIASIDYSSGAVVDVTYGSVQTYTINYNQVIPATSSTLTSDGSGNFTGAVTADSFVGDGTTLTGLVPYTGATTDVDVGTYQVSAGVVKLGDYSTISSPVEGQVAFNYTTHAITYYDGSAWI